MDTFADTVFGTLKRLKKQILSDEEDAAGGSEVNKTAADEPTPAAEQETCKSSSQSNSLEKNKSEEQPAKPMKRRISPGPGSGYASNHKAGKNSTLLAISQNPSDGPNSETGKRTRSMKLANSMNSVYRKLHKDKNIHNDRHYLVSVAEHIKEDSRQRPRPDS